MKVFEEVEFEVPTSDVQKEDFATIAIVLIVTELLLIITLLF